MKKFGMILVPLLLASLTGCARNYYNVPPETFTQKVRTLGVLPIMVDPGSDIGHPQKDAVLQVVREANRKNERAFVSRLKEGGNFLSVQFIEGEADKQFDALFFRREFRDD